MPRRDGVRQRGWLVQAGGMIGMILPKQHLQSANVMERLHESQYQPAGIDITLKEVCRFSNAGKIDFDNRERKISDVESLVYENEEVHLAPGAYKVIFNEYVKIPGNVAALCLPCSSLLRCGVTLECAVWDPGYEGRSEALHVVRNEHGVTLKRNAKIGQMVFIRLVEGSDSPYEGRYKGENKD
ncbi:TPA: deoxyuridine 5'-triphosphate nucleotidohydrolase [Candidatus Micrarchaeota archaeon]|nr:deoxyuridine 5'-triphosphate nucleotidohydrolase [Candidatus Micrarchaeota archaeon]